MLILKKNIRLRSFILLPLLAILIYSFSTKNVVEKDVLHKTITETEIQETLPTINGKKCNECEAILRPKELLKIIIGTSTKESVTSFKFKVPRNPTVVVKGNRLNAKAIEYAKKARNNDLITIFDITTKNGELEKYIAVFISDGTTKSPKINSEDFKNIPPPPPPISPNATPAQKTKQEKVIANYKKRYTIKKGEVSNIPPPPTSPKSPLDHVIDMSKKGAKFTYNGKSITSDKAIELLKENDKLNISSHTNNSESTVNISDKPIRTVNGKVVEE